MRAYSTPEYLSILINATIRAPWFYLNPYRSEKYIQRYQEKQIRKVLDYAYNNTLFYKDKYDKHNVHPSDFHKLSDLEKFPTVTKDELIANFPDGVISEKTRLDKCIKSISSGSSGKVITIVHRALDTWSYALGRFRILNIEGNYMPWDKSLYIYTSPYPASSYLGVYRSYFISTLNNLADTRKQIIEMKPKMISSYPSLMLDLMNHITEKEGRSLKLKLISLGSELSTRRQRDKIATFFGCPVQDEYSSEELGWIAGECKYNNYHLWEDICYLEVMDPKNNKASGEGEIVGTNLHNLAMPIIRYRQGDLGVLSNTACECGRHHRILKSFLGRANDTFILPDGKKLTSAYLLDTVYSLLLEQNSHISDFCLIQENLTNVKMQLVAKEGFTKNDLDYIQSKLIELLQIKLVLEIVKTENLYKTKSGKRNPIISRVRLG